MSGVPAVVCENDEDTNVILKEAEEASAALLPDKSKDRYEKEYLLFCKWRSEKHVVSVTEDVILAYIFERSKKGCPNSLWSYFSMLKATLLVKENKDISKYNKALAFLKTKSRGYVPKKAKTFSREEIKEFVTKAPDDRFLLLKVIMILGLAGGCRREELLHMTTDDVQDVGSMLIVKIPFCKTKKGRKFVVSNNDDLNGLEICRKYFSLRSPRTPHKRLFVQYKNGKCTVQPVGVNNISKVPMLIAEYLKKENPREFTSHCMRRSSATLLVDSGADLLTLKRHGGWRSSAVAEEYIDESITNKLTISEMILNGSERRPDLAASSSDQELPGESVTREVPADPRVGGIVLRNSSFHHCIFNFSSTNS